MRFSAIVDVKASGQEDITEPCGLLGVLHEQTSMTVKDPNDATTWARMEAFVRFASKP